MITINPGSGPVHEGTFANAMINIAAFIEDMKIVSKQPLDIEHSWFSAPLNDGRFRFTLLERGYGESCVVDMPGLPLDQVRFTGDGDQNIRDFPRLYVNGSSWVWCYALSVAIENLLESNDDA